jgi:CreA protein
MPTNLFRLAAVAVLVLVLAACGKDNSQTVGKVGVDWTGNDIVVEAVEDPDAKGVVCHVAYFNRSLLDRLQQGNWFEDPSYSAIDCAASGPVTIGNISTSQSGDDIFKQQRSIVWKSIRVTRIYDQPNNSLIYVAHARELQLGSGKMSMSVVPLNGQQVTWTNGQPGATK